MNINPLTMPINYEKTPDGDVSGHDKARLKQVSEEFESIFMTMLFKTMRESVPKSEMFGSGHGGEVFKSMLDGEYAKVMSEQRSTGIADIIERDLLKAMNQQNKVISNNSGRDVYKQREK